MPTSPDLSPVKTARRARIIAAAEAVFRADGFRGATMEGIATAAGMSKVTVYGYFPDKEAAFLAVAENFAADLEQRFMAALRGPGTIADRIAAALLAKHGAVAETVWASSQARDIFAASDRIAGGVFQALDASLVTALSGALADAGLNDAARLAARLFSAAQGIATAAAATGPLQEDLTFLSTALVAASKAR